MEKMPFLSRSTSQSTTSPSEMCRAKGLPRCVSESSSVEVKITNYDQIKPPEPAKTLICDCVFKGPKMELVDSNEEEEESSFTEPPSIIEELQLEDIREEVLQKKQRVQHIDELLSLNTPECPNVDPCVNMELELEGYDLDPDILELLRDSNKLRQQVEQLKLSCTAADTTIKYLHKALCRDLEAGVNLQRDLDGLDSFKRRMERQTMICKQRYRYLQHIKYDWDDCYAYINARQEESERNIPKYVTRAEYKQPKTEITEILNQTKIHVKELYDGINRVTSRLALGGGSQRVGPEINAFLQRNEMLFRKDSH